MIYILVTDGEADQLKWSRNGSLSTGRARLFSWYRVVLSERRLRGAFVV